jgi:hypothetical protein
MLIDSVPSIAPNTIVYIYRIALGVYMMVSININTIVLVFYPNAILRAFVRINTGYNILTAARNAREHSKEYRKRN